MVCLCQLRIKFTCTGSCNKRVDDAGQLIKRRNGDCRLALFEFDSL